MHCSVVPMLYYCSVRSEETGEIFKPIFHASANANGLLILGPIRPMALKKRFSLRSSV